MVEIVSNAFYSRADLLALFGPLGIDADAWVARLRPVKRFRKAWWGADLIEAINRAPALIEQEERPGPEPACVRRWGGRRAPAPKAKTPALDRLIAELNANGS